MADPATGSYLGLYYVLDHHHDEWNRWAVDQVNALHAAAGCSRSTTTSTPGSTGSSGSTAATPTACPPSSPSTTGSPGWSRSTSSRPPGRRAPSFGASVRDTYLPAATGDSPVASVLGFSPLPLLADAPGDVPRDDKVDDRVLLLCFVDEDPTASFGTVFAPLGAAAEAAGVGRVQWASPFIGTVPGTDTYTDQLWVDH